MEDEKKMVDYVKLFEAINLIHDQSDIAKKYESDDFNNYLIQELDKTAQSVLYLLTRGETGLKNHLTLSIMGPNKILSDLDMN